MDCSLLGYASYSRSFCLSVGNIVTPYAYKKQVYFLEKQKIFQTNAYSKSSKSKAAALV